jgi:hypothetical protein
MIAAMIAAMLLSAQGTAGTLFDTLEDVNDDIASLLPQGAASFERRQCCYPTPLLDSHRAAIAENGLGEVTFPQAMPKIWHEAVKMCGFWAQTL